MNSFYIPALAGQIYAMPGMETSLHAVINKEGTYKGFSANYSGAGFSGMHFNFEGLSNDRFDAWIAQAKASGKTLGRKDYLELERPSMNEPVRRYASVDGELFKAVLNMCVETGKMCSSEMTAIDAKGGLGLAGIGNTLPLSYDKYARRGAVFGPEPAYVLGACNVDTPGAQQAREIRTPVSASPVMGAGLTPPYRDKSRQSSAVPASTSFPFGLRPKSDS